MKNKQKYYQFMLDFHYLLSPHYPSKEIMIEMVAESSYTTFCQMSLAGGTKVAVFVLEGVSSL